MKSKKVRNIAFILHRYIGLAIGIILVIVGLTGSLLVFEHEMDEWAIQQRFGSVVPQEQRLSTATLVDNVKAAYTNHPDWQVGQVQMLPKQEVYTIRLNRPDDTQWEVFVNPYTGVIMGDRQRETALFSRVLDLHYALLIGNTGIVIVGMAAFLLMILSITGIVLWSGWRKLLSGFKIKWNAHPKRLNFDIHKVTGIITAIFLSAIAFTGFCWNFYDYAEPAIYAATFTPKPPEVKSTLVNGLPMQLDEILRRSERALPGTTSTFINLPQKPDQVFEVYKKVPGDGEDFNSYIKLDQFSGKVLYVQDSRRRGGLGDRVLNSFTPLHYGTFGGILTRILYVFVGLSPTILLITGFVMWWHRRKPKGKTAISSGIEESALRR